MEDKRIIIYADDEKYMREIYEEIHKRNFAGGYNLEFYESGKSVEERFEQLIANRNGCGVIILDNSMKPGLSGGELIKKYSSKLNSPMILVSGDCISVGEEAIKNGAYAFVEKPFKLEYICNTIKKALDSKK